MSGTEKEALLNVFAALVRPLMRAAFEYGITASEIASAVRRTYIQALEAKLSDQKRPATDSRLAVVSGLPKSDVSALREALRSGALDGARAGASADQVMSLLTTWHTHSNFSGAYGLAMDLDLVPTTGSPRRSFQELIEAVCPDVNREALLDQLITAGSIEIVDGNTVRCLSRAYLSAGADTKGIERMGWSLSKFTESMVYNLLRAEKDPGYFERFVVADLPMSEKGRDLFLAEAYEKGQTLLAELDTFLTSLAADQTEAAGKKYGVGIYFFEDQTRESQTERHKQAHEAVDHKNSTVQEIDVLAAVNRKQ